MADFTKRHAWTVDIDGRDREVVVEYRMVSGFMSVFVDGDRVARAWREFQTVFGGARLGVDVESHALLAEITQAFGGQEYRFALSLDGRVLPGSDDLARAETNRASIQAFIVLAVLVAVLTIVTMVARG
jgi:hypothetical protein